MNYTTHLFKFTEFMNTLYCSLLLYLCLEFATLNHRTSTAIKFSGEPIRLEFSKVKFMLMRRPTVINSAIGTPFNDRSIELLGAR